MTVIPQVNAELALVGTSGYSEDYNTGAGTNSTKWQGNSGIYVSDRIRRVVAAAGVTRVRDVAVYMDPDLYMQSTVESGDYVTYIMDSGTRTGRVANIESAELPGCPHYMKLSLEEIDDS